MKERDGERERDKERVREVEEVLWFEEQPVGETAGTVLSTRRDTPTVLDIQTTTVCRSRCFTN